jgi:hypothetical protein
MMQLKHISATVGQPTEKGYAGLPPYGLPQTIMQLIGVPAEYMNIKRRNIMLTSLLKYMIRR